jgi:hypothetical protein
MLRGSVLLFCLLIASPLFCQLPDTVYAREWLDIDTLIIRNELPKTALEKINRLYERSKTEQRPVQQIKILLYQVALENRTENQDGPEAVAAFRQQLAATKDPVQQSLLLVLLAGQYQHYFSTHAWQLLQRKQVKELRTDDITQWSRKDFFIAINTCYRKALAPAALLEKESIARYTPLLIWNQQEDNHETLLDLILREYIQHLLSAASYDAGYTGRLINTEAAWFLPATAFITQQIKGTDSSDYQSQIAGIYQQWLQKQIRSADTKLMIETDLERLRWARNNSRLAQKEDLYQQAIKVLLEQYGTSEKSLSIWKEWIQLDLWPSGARSFRQKTPDYVSAMKKITAAYPVFRNNTMALQQLRQMEQQVTVSELMITTDKINIPDQPFLSLITYRNTPVVYGRIIPINSANDSLMQTSGLYRAWKSIAAMKSVRSFRYTMPGTEDYAQHRAEIKMDALPAGRYLLVISASEDFRTDSNRLCAVPLHISRISYVRSGNHYFVLDRKNGQPLKDINVRVLKQIYLAQSGKYFYDTVATRYTNRFGEFSFEPGQQQAGTYRFVFTNGRDQLSIPDGEFLYLINRQNPEEEIAEPAKNTPLIKRIFFFTDRGLYRPGQSVFFKGIGIAYDAAKSRSYAFSKGEKVWVYLRNQSTGKLDSLNLTCNEFGSVSGMFRLPEKGLAGNWMIESPAFNGSRKDFSVEEYKRPSFRVQLEAPQSASKINDSIDIKGKAVALSGNPVANANVQYTFTRSLHYRKTPIIDLRYPVNGNTIIQTGSTTTDEQGNYSIRCLLQGDEYAESAADPRYLFTLQADVTDPVGESQSASFSIAAAVKPVEIRLQQIPTTSDADSVRRIRISTTSLSGIKKPIPVTLRIFRITPPSIPLRTRNWEKPDQFLLTEKEFKSLFPNDVYKDEADISQWPISGPIFTQSIHTGDTNSISLPEGLLKAGVYKIEATADDSTQAEKTTQIITLHQSSTGKQAFPSYAWHHVSANTVSPGDSIRFYSASAVPQAYVIQQLFRNGKENYSFQQRKNGWQQFPLLVTEKDRKGLSLHEVFVWENRLYTYIQPVVIKDLRQQLNIQYSSYRKLTEPGATEDWTVTVSGEKGEKVAAELLSTLYDASLDELNPFAWEIPYVSRPNAYYGEAFQSPIFSIETGRSNPLTPGRIVPYMETSPARFTISMDQLANQSLQQRARTDSSFKPSKYFNRNIRIRGMASGGQTEEVYNKSFSPAAMPLQEKVTVAYGDRDLPFNKPAAVPVTIRKNFNETAFFMPQFTADSSGNFRFRFTMPEALTQWKWMSLAHTKELAFGIETAYIQTQKQLMVQPNAPRFLREGDQIEFSTRVVNMSDKEISGQVRLELIDAAAGSSVDGWFQNLFPAQYFTLEAGKTTVVRFPFQVPYSFNRMLTWRVTATAGNISDGEENNLPVLSKRILVTESMPLGLSGDTTQTFRFNQLINNRSESLSSQLLKLEYTSNPAWYAVQALPWLPSENPSSADGILQQLYTNGLSSLALRNFPEIRSALARWLQDSTKQKSPLSENEQLKQVLLEETPWVLDAAGEKEQQKAVARLLDADRTEKGMQKAVQQLAQLQLPNGAFPWFKDGMADEGTTRRILTGLGRLVQAGVINPKKDPAAESMISKGLGWIEEQVFRSYENISRKKITVPTTGEQLDYLYITSFFPDRNFTNKTAFDYFYKQAVNGWTQLSGYQKALLALVMHRKGDTKKALSSLFPSLRENAVIDKKTGMFWKAAYTGAWHESPIEYQSLMITVYHELLGNQVTSQQQKELDMMISWLLYQKQTHRWGAGPATAEACYALLREKAVSKGKSNIQISMGAQNLITNSGWDDAGYISKTFTGNTIQPQMGNISIRMQSDASAAKNISWGAVYWQYLEDMDQLTQAAAPLKVNKQLFIERKTNGVNTLEPFDGSRECTIGDPLIVRLSFTTDRDMEYVALKDLRAAGTEPLDVLSGHHYQEGLSYYQTSGDVSTQFFFNRLPKGSYVIDYRLKASQTGIFSAGIATLQCLYAPAYSSHSGNAQIRINKSGQ